MKDRVFGTFSRYFVIYFRLFVTSACDVPHNPIYINCSGSGPAITGMVQSGWDESIRGPRYKGDRKSYDLDLSDVNVTASERGVYLSPSEAFKVGHYYHLLEL